VYKGKYTALLRSTQLLGGLCNNKGKYMANISFDHFITYTSAVNIDDYLKEYAAQGFLPHETTVRHKPGLRNGFISFGPEYIEFCWVEDEELFAKADAEEKLLRAVPRPFGIGMIADDVNAVHADWTVRGYSVPEVWSKAPRDAKPDTPPVWSFQEIPTELLPGASCFALTYHTRPKGEAKKIKISPNTIYAISGVTLVSTEPEERATYWRNLLAPKEQVFQSEIGFDVVINPHQATWMTPDICQSTYGLNWEPASHSFGQISVLHLLASNLEIVKQMIEQSGRTAYSKQIKGKEELLIVPDMRDGFVFSIRQQPVESWLQERVARTGEKFEFIQN